MFGWKLVPLPDIVAFELAQAFANLEIIIAPEMLDQLPESVRRHFQPVISVDPAQRKTS